jgi:hypothetical protein
MPNPAACAVQHPQAKQTQRATGIRRCGSVPVSCKQASLWLLTIIRVIRPAFIMLGTHVPHSDATVSITCAPGRSNSPMCCRVSGRRSAYSTGDPQLDSTHDLCSVRRYVCLVCTLPASRCRVNAGSMQRRRSHSMCGSSCRGRCASWTCRTCMPCGKARPQCTRFHRLHHGEWLTATWARLLMKSYSPGCRLPIRHRGCWQSPNAQLLILCGRAHGDAPAGVEHQQGPAPPPVCRVPDAAARASLDSQAGTSARITRRHVPDMRFQIPLLSVVGTCVRTEQ